MRFPNRLGLRAQIVLALSLLFVCSAWLVGVAVVALAHRSHDLTQTNRQHLVADALVAVVDGSAADSDAELSALCHDLVARGSVAALRVERTSGSIVHCGMPSARPPARIALRGGGWLSLWLAAPLERQSVPFADLLLFYMALTGIAVLVFSYFALTHLIVRPLERLKWSTEQLATGGEHVFVQERGPAEVFHLARTFNEMARMLRAERKRLVDRLAELERTTSELEAKKQQLIHGEKLASIGRLAAGVAHEIGNPLAAILGLVELLREGGLSEAQAAEFLARIHRETERINRIIRDLLDFARRDADENATLHTADLREVIADAVNLVRPQKESKDVAINVVVDPLARRVFGPQHRLTQVVLNLLLNAVDALAGKGAIELRVERCADDKLLSLVVEDDGPGIAEDMLDKLFDPFTTTKPAGKGTGLGLAVSHAIVDGLQGSIEARNRPEGGARFEVRLRQVPAPGASGGV